MGRILPFHENDGEEDVLFMKQQLVALTNDKLSEIGDLYSAYDYENIMFNSFYLNYSERMINKIQTDRYKK